VRELRNVVGRAFILADDAIDVDLWPAGDTAVGAAPAAVGGASIVDMERALILATLGRFDGSKRRAAAVLKISLKTLYNRLSDYRT